MELIAHRGASAYAPENTIASFKKAIEMGLKAVEFDVQISKDLELIVIHDYTLERTTSGKGKVRDYTLKELQGLDAGSWFSKEFQGEKIPSLRKVLEVVKNNEFINIELKRDKNDKRKFDIQLIDLIDEMKIKDKVIISSFDHEILVDIFELDNTLSLALLFHEEIRDLKEYIDNLGIKINSINPNKNSLNENYIKKIKELNLNINAYTINSYEEYVKLNNLGIDRIFTNFPDLLSKNI